MSADALDILLIQDNPGDARLIEEMLRDAEDLRKRVNRDAMGASAPRTHHETQLSAGLERLSGTDVDVILLDLGLPDSTGLDTLAAVTDTTTFVPIVVLTGLRDDQLGIEAIQRGAQDYLVKDEVTSNLLVRSIHHAIERNRQKRERAWRREQLDALNTLTRELMDVETPAQVCEYVVGAAAEMLDLPVTTVALYDDREGTLEPAEMTDAAAEVVRASSLFDAGDGAGWQAFVENERRRTTAPLSDGDETVGSSVTELAIFPLAEHGVFVTGSTAPSGFSTTDFEFAETVAGNVRATLDRVDRERQLHDRERALEAQNQTLERLRRINDTIRTIARALVRASTRQEIENVVCEQLADVGPYEMALIGEYDVMAEEITLSDCAGDRGSLESLASDIDGRTGITGPADRAAETRQPQVVNDLLGDPSSEPWRQDALNRGFHAAIALPLTYEDTLYGALTIYAGQPDVFDELERAVLTELADTIAYAINAVESKKALVGDEVRRLTFTVTDPNLVIGKLTRELDCTFAVENMVPRTDGGVREFFATRGVQPDAVRGFASRLPVRNLTLVSEYEGEDGEPVCLFKADLTDESLAATVLEHGGRLHAVEVENGTATVEIDLATDAVVAEFVEMFRTKFPRSELVAQRTHERSRRSPAELRASLTETLTDRQREALQTAYFSGYFEEPRVQTASDIADSMGITQPTFTSHLRAAERKLYRELFREAALTV